VAKLIPKTAQIFKKIEKIVVNKVEDEAELLAASIQVDKLFKQFNELSEWHDRFSPKARFTKKSKKGV